ncbi:hypothetical protein Q9L58_001888 [Maublancomyces gigas]|uniref:Ubiquitin-like domain-containing protein n=1 Tax=Discina gigas TaxID=1032678 RepID=A0ABR3GSW4_9PEZI
MPVPGFGYSVGDFIATIELIAKVIAAFRDGTGASSEYRQVLQELETLLNLLQHISTVQSTERNFACVNAIKGVALNLQAPLRKFLDNICKRYGALGGGQKKGPSNMGAGLAVIGRKAQWAIVMEKDIAKLRTAIGTNMSSILLLLNMNHLDATSFMENLAKVNQNDLLLKNAEIQQELVLQQSTTSRHHVQQMDSINGVKSNIGDLTAMSSANADRLGVIERRQNSDSIALMQFLEYMKRIVLSLRTILPSIYEIMCKMMSVSLSMLVFWTHDSSKLPSSLSNLHLYALLLSIQTTVSEMPTSLLSSNIQFEDVLGRVRSLPYESFRYWKVFQTFLECEFENLPGELNIRRGLYHIVDTKLASNVTGESAWSQGVFPGMRLQMSVIIESFRRRGRSCPRPQCPGVSEGRECASPFLVCSNCSLRFTDISEMAQPRITELEDTLGKRPVSVQSPSSGLRGPAKAALHSIHPGACRDDTIRRRRDLVQAKLKMRDRERLDIVKFKRIHIYTFDDMKAEFGSLKLLDLPTAPMTLLQKAAAMGNVTLVAQLIEDGVNIDEEDRKRWTAMHHAAWSGCWGSIHLLLENGANIDKADHWCMTPLHYAVRKGDEQVVKLLIQNGAAIDAEGAGRWTPLHFAAAHGNDQVAQLLIQNGVVINAENKNRQTPLHFAAADGNDQVAQLLIQNGAAINAEDNDGWTPLFHAAVNGRNQVAQLLIQNGAAINAEDNDGWTPLFHAAANGRDQVAQLLIQNGATINAEAIDRWTPLHCATSNGHDRVAQLLIQNGATVDAEDCSQFTPLHYAAANGHVQVAQLLIQHGAAIHTPDYGRLTPLHCAAGNGHNRMALLLIENGATINAEDKFGRTPLVNALEDGQDQMVRLLREMGGR